MYRLVRKSVKLFCPFVPKRMATFTKRDKVSFSGKNTMPKTIFRVKRNKISVTVAGSIVNSSNQPLTVVIKRTSGIIANTIEPGSSITFVRDDVQKVKVLGTNAPYCGTFDYQATFKN